MNTKKLFKDLSANTIQTGVTQLCGILIFYIMSRYISKDSFGEYNWSTAVGSTIIAIGSLGLDLVLVKRIASGEDARLMAGIHFFHTILIGLLLLIAIFLVQLFFPGLLKYHPLFTFILIQLSVSNIANSFKFSLNGLEAFKSLAIISVFFNIAKLISVVILFVAGVLSLKNLVLGFLITSTFELILAYFLVSKKISRSLIPLLRKETYKSFILESLPQLGVVLFDSALARIDWILLGIFSTVSITAEYSFAYKFFELSKLPLLILAPVILTRFSKMFSNGNKLAKENEDGMQKLLELEIFIAYLIPIFMVCVWTELIDFITVNKYGKVNQTIYTILSFCIPFHFIINFLWTILFVSNRLKTIMYITIFVSVLNTLLNVVLIPKMGSLGAAISFLTGTVFQIACYLFYSKKLLRLDFKIPIFLGIIASLATFFSGYIFSNAYLSGLVAVTIYIVSAIFMKLVPLNFLKK